MGRLRSTSPDEPNLDWRAEALSSEAPTTDEAEVAAAAAAAALRKAAD
jgi:hypothetical protein